MRSDVVKKGRHGVCFSWLLDEMELEARYILPFECGMWYVICSGGIVEEIQVTSVTPVVWTVRSCMGDLPLYDCY